MSTQTMLSYDFNESSAGVLPAFPASEYVHRVNSIWHPNLSVFGDAPLLDVQASFLARAHGGVLELPGYVTLHAGGTVGFARFDDNIASDDELITTASGFEVFSEEIPWTAGAGTYAAYNVAAQMPNLGGRVPFRFGLRYPAGQRISRIWLLLTLRAAS